MSPRAWIGLIALGGLIAPGCSETGGFGGLGPDDPADPSGSITVTVSREGQPVSGATVALLLFDFGPITGTAGPDGSFTFSELATGTYPVAALVPGLFCDQRDGFVPTGEAVTIDIICAVPPAFGGPAGIYVASADGSAATPLTRGNRPAWSPDGQRIAFDREGEIHVINADGSNEIILTRGVDPAWSPDGTRIAFDDGEGISLMNADGSGITALIRDDFISGLVDGQGVGKPAWSPDGRNIAFEHLGDGDLLPAQIYVMNADGSAPRRLTPTSGIQFAESDPAWSPDGSIIVFWSFGYGIATVDVSGCCVPSTVFKDFPFVHYGAGPDWSPEGTIAFAADRIGNPHVYAVDTSGFFPQLLVAEGYDPTWSPDGNGIAFVPGHPDD